MSQDGMSLCAIFLDVLTLNKSQDFAYWAINAAWLKHSFTKWADTTQMEERQVLLKSLEGAGIEPFRPLLTASQPPRPNIEHT